MKLKKTAFILAASVIILGIAAVILFKPNKPQPLAPVEPLPTQPLAAQYTDTALFLSPIKQTTIKPATSTVTGLIVPHHLLAKDLMAEAYAYASSGQYQTIVLLSPDHFNAGKTEVSTTDRDFSTVFGTVATDKNIVNQLKKLSFIGNGNFFYREHGLEAQLPFIKYYFPKTKVVALTFKPTVSQDKLDQIITVLKNNLPPDSLIVESTDFSHYLTPAQAALKDSESIKTITDNGDALALNQPDNVDSKAALYIESTLERDFFKNSSKILEHKNSQDYTKETVTSSTSYLVAAYQPQMPVKASNEAELVFTGDIMLSRHIGELMAQKQDYNFPYEKIKNDLASADLVFGNLETPVSSNGQDAGHLYSFRANPLVLSGLKNTGFKVVSVANNHAFDYGLEAFTDTLANLKNNGIAYTGGGKDLSEAHSGATLEINGVKITFLAYTDLLPQSAAATDNQAGFAYLDETQMVKDIKEAKTKSDLVIVSFHWGQEYQTKSNAHQQKIAAEAVKAGANLIIGHHPHVAQEVSKIDGTTVAYSLGNFIFDQNFSTDTKNALILKVKIKNKKIIQVEPEKIKFTGSFQPYLVK